jgi:hypothetical protein
MISVKTSGFALLLILSLCLQGFTLECKAASSIKTASKAAPAKYKIMTKPKSTVQVMVPFSKAQPKLEKALNLVKDQHQRVMAAYQINRFRETMLRQLTTNGMSMEVMPNAMKKIEELKTNWDTGVAQFFTTQENALTQSMHILAQKKMVSEADLNYVSQGVSIGQWRISQLMKVLTQSVDAQARLSFVEQRITVLQDDLKKIPDWEKQQLTAKLTQFKQQEKDLKFSLERAKTRQKELTEKPVFTAFGVTPRQSLSKEDIQWGVIFQSAIEQQNTRKRLHESAGKTLDTLKQKELEYDKIKQALDEQEKALIKKLSTPLNLNKTVQKEVQGKWDAMAEEILASKKSDKPVFDQFEKFDQWEKLNQQIRQEQVSEGTPSDLQGLQQMEADLLELTAQKNTLRLELEEMQQTLKQVRDQEQAIPEDPTLLLFIN